MPRTPIFWSSIDTRSSKAVPSGGMSDSGVPHEHDHTSGGSLMLDTSWQKSKNPRSMLLEAYQKVLGTPVATDVINSMSICPSPPGFDGLFVELAQGCSMNGVAGGEPVWFRNTFKSCSWLEER